MARYATLQAIVLGAFLVPPFATVPSAAQKVDVELALAIDVSGSVDAEEARLQREGYIQAFRSAEVIEAIAGGFHGRIALLYFEFSAFGYNRIIADWTEISDTASARAFTNRLAAAPIRTGQRTSISEAINFVVPLFDGNNFDGIRKVIDVSGDGPNNGGPTITSARQNALAKGITINGLPIINARPGPSGRPPPPDLDLYDKECVIGGKGSFLVVADSFEDFAAAIRQKLLIEIAESEPALKVMRLAQLTLVGQKRLTLPGPWTPAAMSEFGPPPCESREGGWNWPPPW